MNTRHTHFWRPFKIGLALTLLVILGYWLVSPGPVYQPPVNGQYNSPSNTAYEDAVRAGAQPDQVEGKSTAEQLGEEAGQTWNGVREGGSDFWDGLKSTAE